MMKYCCGCGYSIIVPKERREEVEGNESDLYCSDCLDDDECFR